MSLDLPGNPWPRCRICGEALDRLRAARGDVCERPACRHTAYRAAVPARSTGRCRHCGAPLDPTSARIDSVCRRPACRQHEDELVERAARERLALALRSQLSDSVGAGRAAAMPVVWISANRSSLQPLPDTLREAQIAHLRALAADLASALPDGEPDAAGPRADPPSQEETPPARAESQLCAWCGGRCCRYGGESHAYLRVEHLRRWREAHPGCSPDDVVQAYADRLPGLHVAGSCAYHGERGCTLDRTMRAEVCNRFACDGLREVQSHPARDSGEFLFVMVRRGSAENLVRADAAGLHPLHLPTAI